jgi:hypothetical protein
VPWSNQLEQAEQSEQTMETAPREPTVELDGKCTVCGTRLDQWLIAQGETIHPGCSDLS